MNKKAIYWTVGIIVFLIIAWMVYRHFYPKTPIKTTTVVTTTPPTAGPANPSGLNTTGTTTDTGNVDSRISPNRA